MRPDLQAARKWIASHLGAVEGDGELDTGGLVGIGMAYGGRHQEFCTR